MSNKTKTNYKRLFAAFVLIAVSAVTGNVVGVATGLVETTSVLMAPTAAPD